MSGEELRAALERLACNLAFSWLTPVRELFRELDPADWEEVDHNPIVLLAGVHVGCFELVATDQVHAIRDLKGRSVAVSGLGGPDHTFVASMLAHVGVDPRRDVTWVTHPATVSMKLLAEGKIDAFLGFPPIPQELRAKKVGRVVVNSATDRPWSQYFCCIATGNREFVRKHPVATKRALRAILKSADICALEQSAPPGPLSITASRRATTMPCRR